METLWKVLGEEGQNIFELEGIYAVKPKDHICVSLLCGDSAGAAMRLRGRDPCWKFSPSVPPLLPLEVALGPRM